MFVIKAISRIRYLTSIYLAKTTHLPTVPTSTTAISGRNHSKSSDQGQHHARIRRESEASRDQILYVPERARATRGTGEQTRIPPSCLAPGDRPSSTPSRSSHSSQFQNFPRSQRWFPRSRPRATTAASVILGRQIILPLHAHLPYRLPLVLDSSPVELAVVVVLPTSVRTVYLLDLMPDKPGSWHHHHYLLLRSTPTGT